MYNVDIKTFIFVDEISDLLPQFRDTSTELFTCLYIAKITPLNTMLLNISFNDREDILQFETSSSMSVADTIALIIDEAGKPVNARYELLYNQVKLDDAQLLSSYGISDGDLLVLVTNPSASANGNASASGSTTTNVNGSGAMQSFMKKLQLEQIRKQLLQDPASLNFLSSKIPGLAESINDSNKFAELYTEFEKQAALSKAANDEIEHNFQMAIQEMPEAFVPVSMLFASVEINNVKVTAFVDSGAQATIMSPECVKRCHLENLVDVRHRGMAYGVGKATIVGRIHMAPIKLGSSFFPCSIMVIEGAGLDFLLGLDMLKHHQATIDLKNNQLVMGRETLKFLSESEIPNDLAMMNRNVQDRESTSANTATPAPTPATVNDADVQNLMQLGFTKSEVIAALKQTNGDAELAASLLFG